MYKRQGHYIHVSLSRAEGGGRVGPGVWIHADVKLIWGSDSEIWISWHPFGSDDEDDLRTYEFDMATGGRGAALQILSKFAADHQAEMRSRNVRPGMDLIFNPDGTVTLMEVDHDGDCCPADVRTHSQWAGADDATPSSPFLESRDGYLRVRADHIQPLSNEQETEDA